MFRLLAAAALLAAAPAAAQTPPTPQDALQARYDRAVAAGYKALMVCGAIGNSDPSGRRRSVASVEAWELADIQQPHGAIASTMPAQLVRASDQYLDFVLVGWAEEMPPRVARFKGVGKGCALEPIGAPIPDDQTLGAMRVERAKPEPRTTGPIAELARTGFESRYGEKARTTAVLIQQGGRIRGEAYAPGFDGDLPQRTWSVAKSIAATLVGMAVQRGEARNEASAGLGDAASDPRRAITIDNLLRMASGRYSDTPGNRTDALYFGGATVRETALHWPIAHRPGTVFRYANNDTLAAVVAITPTFAAHPPSELFATLGMTGTVAETDWRGDYVLSSQVWSTARDLAKLGQLYLQRGKWGDKQVIPADWLDYVSRPSGPQPVGEQGYGAGFWLLNKSEGVPADTIAMQGNRGQYVVIVPSRDVVIVRRGEDGVSARFDIAGFTRDVLAGL